VRRAALAPPKGIVSLVAAGCDVVDLITLRGARRIEMAEVILHDRLSDMRLLGIAAQLIHVGKDPDGPASTRERIDAL
jgi:siroheme synthase